MNRPYLIAEIGGNHQGSINRLHKITDLAISAKPDCIKFQMYSGDSLVNKKIDSDRNKHFKKFEISSSVYLDIAHKLKKYNIDFSASFWDYNFYEKFKNFIPFIKIGSGDMTNYPLIELFSKTNKKLIISTGLSDFDEIKHMVEFVRNCNPIYSIKENLCLLQCTSMYPINDDEANLLVIKELKKLNLSVGYSDHTIGIDALHQAAILGADILEFHFTDNKEDKSFRDHQVSLNKFDLIKLKNKISKSILFNGSPKKYPTKSEIETNHKSSFRRGIYSSKNIKKGKIIEIDDMVFLRPEISELNSSKYFKEIIGTKATKNYFKNDPILWKKKK